MRNYTILYILIILFGLPNTINAQKQKTEPINSGFVFIDGKYIESPYIIERKGLELYINNIRIHVSELETNPFKNGYRAPIPTGITKYSTREETSRLSREYMKSRFKYFFSKYPYQQALDSVVESYRVLPSVKEIENKDINAIARLISAAENYLRPA